MIKMDLYTDELINDLENKLNAFLSEYPKDERENPNDFLKNYDQIFTELNKDHYTLKHLFSVLKDDEIIQTYEKYNNKFIELQTKLAQSPQVFKQISHNDNELKLRYIKILRRNGIVLGVNLSIEERNALNKNNTELNDLYTKFMLNVGQSMKETLAEGNISMPDYLKIMKTENNRDIRKEMFIRFNTKASSIKIYDKGELSTINNEDLIKQIIDLRHQNAKLLGFDNYTQVSLMTKMAKDPITFIDDLIQKIKPHAQKELDEMSQMAGHEIKSWDIMYYSNKMKNTSGVDLTPYFQFDNVLQGLFKVIRKLFNIQIVETDEEVYHKSVKHYMMIQHEPNFAQNVGYFYLDPFTRPNKNPGGWTACVDDKSIRSTYIVCNFNSSDLRFDEVTTLFHEFGHMLQNSCSVHRDCNFLSGFNNLEWDTIEIPSQFLEKMASVSLDLISSHKDTKEVLKYEVIKELQDNKNRGEYNLLLRQLGLAKVDLMIHSGNDFSFEMVENIMKETLLVYYENSRELCYFGHLFGSDSYAAAYYSYLYGEVMSSDIFEASLNDSDISKKFRDTFLFQGASKDPEELFIECMGRELSNEAFLKEKGIN